MKWFFGLNEQSEFFDEYALMMKVAVLTAQKHTSLQPHFLYDGEENDVTEWLRKRDVVIIKRRSFVYDDLAKIAEERDNILFLKIGSGAFLRTEIPQIAQELNFPDKYVLYTDIDVMFLRDMVTEINLFKPKYFAVAPEIDIHNYKDMNSGVMLMNLKNLGKIDTKFRQYIRRELNTLVDNSWDQGAYKFYFKTFWGADNWGKLPPEFNWKPYWGKNDAAKIIHFHGPKPNHREMFFSENVPERWQTLLPLVNEFYKEMCYEWESFAELCK